MPFIKPERRHWIDAGKTTGREQPGDLCYIHYKRMIDQWKASPRWTTAHNIYADIVFGPNEKDFDNHIAKLLAWQVFFQLHVIPYELKKRKENGDI